MNSALTFVAPPPGLAPLTQFTLQPVDGAPGLFTMVADDKPDLRLYVVDAGLYLPDYAPEITDDQALSIALDDPSDALVLAVANPAAAGTTVNLMAPIVVNTSNGASAQFILDGQDWPMQERLGARAA